MREQWKEKNNLHDPSIQFSIAGDADGLPSFYKQFPGKCINPQTV